MKYTIVPVVMLLAACATSEVSTSDSASDSATDSLPELPPPPPVGLYGDWIRVAPHALRGDTLHLAADFTARGIIPWPPQRLARISRWKIAYMSRDPVAEREDWKQGHKDGGVVSCFVARTPEAAAGCRSLPTLCLGALTQYKCEKFVFTRDSLLFSSGMRYVRLRQPEPTAGETE